MEPEMIELKDMQKAAPVAGQAGSSSVGGPSVANVAAFAGHRVSKFKEEVDDYELLENDSPVDLAGASGKGKGKAPAKPRKRGSVTAAAFGAVRKAGGLAASVATVVGQSVSAVASAAAKKGKKAKKGRKPLLENADEDGTWWRDLDGVAFDSGDEDDFEIDEDDVDFDGDRYRDGRQDPMTMGTILEPKTQDFEHLLRSPKSILAAAASSKAKAMQISGIFMLFEFIQMFREQRRAMKVKG